MFGAKDYRSEPFLSIRIRIIKPKAHATAYGVGFAAGPRRLGLFVFLLRTTGDDVGVIGFAVASIGLGVTDVGAIGVKVGTNGLDVRAPGVDVGATGAIEEEEIFCGGMEPVPFAPGNGLVPFGANGNVPFVGGPPGVVPFEGGPPGVVPFVGGPPGEVVAEDVVLAEESIPKFKLAV